MAGVGNGATFAVTFASGTAFACTIIEGNAPTLTVADINDTNLGTTNCAESFQGSLVNPGEFTATIEFTPTSSFNYATHISVASTGLLRRGPGASTLSFPATTSGNTTKSTLTGSGFFTRFSLPQLQSDGKMVSQITFKYDGKTEPAFTHEAA